MSKLRLWLIRHGIEYENLPETFFANGWKRRISITVNHRYWGVEFRVYPFKGVFRDELDTPHAEIAAEYERDQRAT